MLKQNLKKLALISFVLLAGLAIGLLQPCGNAWAQPACPPGTCAKQICDASGCGWSCGPCDDDAEDAVEEELPDETVTFIAKGGRSDFNSGNVGIFLPESREGDKIVIAKYSNGSVKVEFFDKDGNPIKPKGLTYIYFNLTDSQQLMANTNIWISGNTLTGEGIPLQSNEVEGPVPRVSAIIPGSGEYGLVYSPTSIYPYINN